MVKKAIILVGGKGERFKPLSDTTPKPLLPLKGKMIVEYIFDVLKQGGITNVTLSVGHMADKFKETLKDGSHLDLNINYVTENEPLGTAGFLHLNPITETTFVINGDDIFHFNAQEFIEKHKTNVENGAIATLALTNVEDPSSFGTVNLDGEKIKEFVEKGEAISNSVSVGNYIMEPTIMDYLPQKKFVMFEKDIFPILAKQDKLFSYNSSAKWTYLRDINDYNKWNSLN